MNYSKGLLSNYKFDSSKFKLGMRTFKTGLAVLLALLISHLFGWEGLQMGTLTAVFSLHESLDKSVHFGSPRMVGNDAGGLLPLLFSFINQFSHNQFWIALIFVPIFTVLGITINVPINDKAGIIDGASALLIITLSIPAGDIILYVFARVSETFCGVFVAIPADSDVDKTRGLLCKRS